MPMRQKVYFSRYETVCQYRTQTFSIAWRSLLLILGHLIHTLAPLKVPSHTSERFVEATSQSPTLASLPEMMCEGGRIRWWLQISCSLFRHRRETSSVTGMIPRAYSIFCVRWKGAEGITRTLSRKSTRRVNSGPWRPNK